MAQELVLVVRRGLLMHVEHLVIIGMIGDVTRDQRMVVTPSVEAVYEAFDLLGSRVRAAADSRGLREVLVGMGAVERAELASLRHVLICRWLTQPLPVLPGVDSGRLETLVEPIERRVAA